MCIALPRHSSSIFYPDDPSNLGRRVEFSLRGGEGFLEDDRASIFPMEREMDGMDTKGWKDDSLGFLSTDSTLR